MGARLKVVFFPPPPHQKVPWEHDVIAAFNGRHELLFWDPQQAVPDQLRGADVVIDYGGHNGTREMADAGASIKLWQILSVGYENFDTHYWHGKRIPLANCPGQTSANALAECAFMFMLMLARRWKETQANLTQGIFYLPMGTELEGKSLAILGFGASGRALARRASAFRMRVSAIEVAPVSEEEKTEFGLEFAGRPDQIDQVIRESDYVSLHLPSTPETRRIIDARRLGLMKPTARLINVARGALVDQDALYQALVDGAIDGAGLDVFDPEPIDPSHPLLKLPNVVATPHLAGNTFSTSQRRAEFVAENVDRIAAGEMPRSRIDS